VEIIGSSSYRRVNFSVLVKVPFPKSETLKMLFRILLACTLTKLHSLSSTFDKLRWYKNKAVMDLKTLWGWNRYISRKYFGFSSNMLTAYNVNQRTDLKSMIKKSITAFLIFVSNGILPSGWH
jgi:hypothetical protein